MIKNYLTEGSKVEEATDYNTLIDIYNVLRLFVDSKQCIFVCGNGGSANLASHFVTDLAKMLYVKKGQSLKIYSLNDNIGAVTAYANDIGYSEVFSMQLKNYSSPGDAVILVSGSGKSTNMCDAIDVASQHGLTKISFTGFDGGYLKSRSDYKFHVPSFNMQIGLREELIDLIAQI